MIDTKRYGLWPDNDVTVSGSGNITITAKYGISTSGNVIFSGSGNTIITAGYYGISAGGVVIKDTCKVSVDAGAGDYAVCLWDSGSKLLLNGTGAPISLKSGTGKAAVWNYADSNSPVGGTKLSFYTVTGDPASSEVIYDHMLTIAGNSYSSTELLSDIDKVSSEGWKWNASAQELTLSGYNGSYIRADMALDIVLADGTENAVSVPVDVAEHGISTYGGGCTISGNGSLNIEVLNLDRIGVQVKGGDLTVDMTGDLTVNAGLAGFLAENYLTISGSGNITVTVDGNGIVSDKDVVLSGSRNIIITAGHKGISAGGVEIKDTCKVSVDAGASDSAVHLWRSGSKLLLNGTGSPISLKSGTGKAAVWNYADSNSPVGGTNLSYYDNVTGAPNESKVVYRHGELTLPFTDVKKSDWSFGDIAYVYEKGLMQGTSATTFSPKMTTSRGMIVTILLRLEGEPVVNYAISFDDVADGKWYTEAIRWAQANSIVNGYSAEKFGPNDPITREQMAAIFYRYAEFKG